MFKIRVNTLPASGLRLEQLIATDQINARILEAPNAQENEICFKGQISIAILCEKAPHGMTLSGEIRANCDQQCGLCAQPATRDLVLPINHVFNHQPEDQKLPEDDIGLTYYHGEQVDIMPCIEELLILQLSPYWRPAIQSDGNCSFCLKNPRSELKPIKIGTQSLGDVFKKAGLKS
jgi:uncharacterized metal-binding protein YceD (DUF177 family)